MNVFIIFISCFVLWGGVLGIPYLVAKKVNQKGQVKNNATQNIVPTEAYIHSCFLYVVIIYIISNLMLQIKDPSAQLAFKSLIVILLVGFSYQTLRLFRK